MHDFNFGNNWLFSLFCFLYWFKNIHFSRLKFTIYLYSICIYCLFCLIYHFHIIHPLCSHLTFVWSVGNSSYRKCCNTVLWVIMIDHDITLALNSLGTNLAWATSSYQRRSQQFNLRSIWALWKGNDFNICEQLWGPAIICKHIFPKQSLIYEWLTRRKPAAGHWMTVASEASPRPRCQWYPSRWWIHLSRAFTATSAPLPTLNVTSDSSGLYCKRFL